MFEQVDGISDLNFTCSYDLTHSVSCIYDLLFSKQLSDILFQEWVIGESNNTYIVSEVTNSLCPSNNYTEHAWFYATNVR